MSHRLVHNCCVASAILAVLTVTGLAAGAWRLAMGPVDLSFLVPRIEAELNRADDDDLLTVVDDVVLTWSDWRRPLDIQARGVHVLDGQRLAAEVERLSLGFSGMALLAGRLELSSLVVDAPVLTAVRHADGSIDVGIGAGTATTGKSGPPEIPDVRSVVDALGQGPIGALEDIEIRDAVVLLEDEASGALHRIDPVDMVVRMRDGALETALRGRFHGFGGAMAFEADGRLDLDRALWSAAFRLPDVTADAVRAAIPGDVVPRELSGTAAVEVTASARHDGGVDATVLMRAEDVRLGSPNSVFPLAELRSVDVAGSVTALQPETVRGIDDLIRTVDLVAMADGTVWADGGAVPVTASAKRAAGAGDAVFTAEIDGIRPDALIARLSEIPELNAVAATAAEIASDIDVSVDLGIAGAVGIDGRLRRATITAETGAGRIAVPPIYPEPLDVLAVEADLTLLPDRRSLGWTARVAVDGGDVALYGEVSERPDGARRLAAQVRASDVRTDRVIDLWPRIPGDNSRAWTAQNVRDGIVPTAWLEADVILPADGGEPVFVHMDGWSDPTGITVTYIPGIPPVRGVDARIRTKADDLDFFILDGRHRGVRVGPGRVAIASLNRHPQTFAIDLPARGSLQDALTALDNDPLNYARKAGRDPADISGRADLRLAMRFPLLKDLVFEQMDIDIRGRVRDGGIRDVALGLEAEALDAEIAITARELRLAGAMSVAGAPTSVTWREVFDPRSMPTGTPRTAITVDTVMEAATLAGADLPEFLDRVSGPVPLSMQLTTDASRAMEIGLDLDLTATAIDVSEAGWTKPPGAASAARLSLGLDADLGLRRVDVVEATGPDLELRGRVLFPAETPDTLRAEFPLLGLGATRLTDVGLRTGPGGTEFAVADGRLDLSPFTAAGGSEDDADAPMEGVDLSPFADLPDVAGSLSADLRLKTVRFGPDRALGPTAVTLRHDGRVWRHAAVETRTDGGAPARLHYVRGRTPHELAVQAADLGDLLRVLTGTGRIRDGALLFSASRDVGAPGAPLVGRLKVESYTLLEAPIVAHVLSIASLTGILDVLNGGGGLAFSELTADMALDDDVLKIRRAKTFSTSLGVTVAGEIDLGEPAIDVTGTVAPAYILSRVVGSIPLVGDILTGTGNEGVFAATYAVDGRLDDPSVSVNPLAALAPGILRDLFGSAGDAAEAAVGDRPETARRPVDDPRLND